MNMTKEEAEKQAQKMQKEMQEMLNKKYGGKVQVTAKVVPIDDLDKLNQVKKEKE